MFFLLGVGNGLCYNQPMEQRESSIIEGSVPVAAESLEQLLARARAEGNPWALAAGIFPDDDLTRAWIEEMQAARRRADDAPDF